MNENSEIINYTEEELLNKQMETNSFFAKNITSKTNNYLADTYNLHNEGGRLSKQ